jgi:hypothetical protein
MIPGNVIEFNETNFNPEIQKNHLLEGQTLPNLRSYVSTEDKYSLQQEIGTRIRPYLFLHAENLEKEQNEALKRNPESFYRELCINWEWHIDACNKIDVFLSNRPPGVLDVPTVDDWQSIKLLLTETFDSDTAKSVYSAAIKKYLQSNIEQFINHHPELTEEERLLVYTPSEEVFYTKYIYDHSDLGIELTAEEREELESELADRYHHGDLDLLRIRTNDMPILKGSYDEILSFQTST